MTSKLTETFNVPAFLEAAGIASQTRAYQRAETIVTQGEPCQAVFYLHEGRVRLSVTSSGGRAAVVAMLAAGDFFGEGCLTGKVAHLGSAIAATDCRVLRIAKDQMLRVLHTEHAMSTRFIAHLLARNIRVEEDLIDQMFHSSEKRLARALLLLAQFDTPPDAGPAEPPRAVPPITQETLADMIGTTRSRVNVFLKKFARLGLIDARDGLKVHHALWMMIRDE